MITNTIGTRGKAVGLSLAAVAALVLSLANSFGVGHAFNRAASAPHAAANVFIAGNPSSNLWVTTMDPALQSDTSSTDVVQKIYAGLVKQVYNRKTGKFDVVPDLAQSWSVGSGGLVYTFKIRKDAGFSDGTPVTAQDFVWSFERVLSPKANSPVTYYLFDIKGASDFASGKTKSFAQVGVKALDAHTLQITLWHPVVYFLYALSYPTGYVVKRNLPIGAKVTTDPSLVVGAGPWMLKNHTWKYRSEVILVPNPHYPGSRNFKLTEIDEFFPGTVETWFAGYKSGQFPSTQLPPAEVPHYRGDPNFHETVLLVDAWYNMNVHIKPFSDIHFRRAIAYAIDRNALANGVLRGTVTPLYGWYPKGILGYEPNILKYPGVPYYNPTIAKQELALAKKDLGSIPSVQLEVNTETGSRTKVALAVQQELKAIGINMSLHLVPGNTWVNDGNAGKVPFIHNTWQDDYPDPQDFSDYLLKSGAPQNWGRFSNPTVDRLFTQGAVEKDTQKREALYKQAQLIILRDASVAMLYQNSVQTLISPKLHGLEMNPSWGSLLQPVGNNWANVSVSS